MRTATAQRFPLPMPFIKAYYTIWNLICNNKISCGSAVVATSKTSRPHTWSPLYPSHPHLHYTTTVPRRQAARQLPVLSSCRPAIYRLLLTILCICVFSIGAYPEHCFFFCIIIILHAFVDVRQSVGRDACRKTSRSGISCK